MSASYQRDVSHVWRIVPLLVIVLFFCFFSLLGYWRHWGYLVALNDVGAFDQAIWGAANGHQLLNTSLFSQPINWLGFHFQPVLYLFVPLYKVLPSINWLITAQALALSVGGWPVYLIARHVTESDPASFLWLLVYLFSPWIWGAAAWDFHPVALAVPFIAFGMLAVIRRNRIMLTMSCLVLLTCKEDMGLVVAGFGLLYGVRNRDWGYAIVMLLLGITAFLLVIEFVMPAFSPLGRHPMLSSDFGQLSRYSWLGSTIPEILKTVVTRPFWVLKSVMLPLGGLIYLLLLLLPFGFLPLRQIVWLLPVAGVLAVNMLSANSMPRSPFSYHSAALVPALFVASLYASRKRPVRFGKLSSRKWVKLVLLINLVLIYFFAPLPFPRAKDLWQPINRFAGEDPVVSEIRQIIGESPISVQANTGAHFSQRQEVYRFPRMTDKVDFIVLRLESPTRRLQPHEVGRVGALAHHLQLPPGEYLDAVSMIVTKGVYGVRLWEESWLVLQRGHDSGMESSSVIDKLARLSVAWGVSAGEVRHRPSEK